MSICKFENEAILRDFLNFRTWQHQRRSNSSRLPQILNVTTAKTKLFCETSIFQVDNIKNEAILWDFPQKWKLECRADGLVPLRFAIFPLHLCKALRLPRKSDARSYEVLHPSRKIISANLKIWCSKMQLLSGNQRPDLLTSLSYRACHAKCIFPDPLQMSHACDRFWKCYKALTVWSLLARCRIPCACNAKPHLNVESGPRPSVFYTFRFHMCFAPQRGAHGVHFFDMSTSKSAPRTGVFGTLWLRNVLLHSQRRALFRHLNFQKWSAHEVFCTVWLGNKFRATTACSFSSLISADGSTALASLLFHPPEPDRKNSDSRQFYLFAHLRLLSSDSFSSLSHLFSSLSHLFSSLTLPAAAFSSVHIVGGLTSKLLRQSIGIYWHLLAIYLGAWNVLGTLIKESSAAYSEEQWRASGASLCYMKWDALRDAMNWIEVFFVYVEFHLSSCGGMDVGRWLALWVPEGGFHWPRRCLCQTIGT